MRFIRRVGHRELRLKAHDDIAVKFALKVAVVAVHHIALCVQAIKPKALYAAAVLVFNVIAEDFERIAREKEHRAVVNGFLDFLLQRHQLADDLLLHTFRHGTHIHSQSLN